MATKYLIAGGNYSSDLIWSTESGGVNDTTHPTETDDVICDAASGSVTLTVNVLSRAKSINAETFTGALIGTTFYLIIMGNCKISGALTVTAPLYFTAAASCELTTNGAIIDNTIVVNSTTLKLLDDLTMGDNKTLSFTGSGSLTTNNYNITCGLYSISNAYAKTFTLGSSEITCSGITITDTTPTITANTAKFIVNQAATGNMSFSHGTAQFYDLELNGYNDANSVKAFAGDLTCTHSLKLAGRGADKKLWIKSSVPGTVRTITAPSVIVENCDFTDIKGAGDGWPPAVKNLYNSSLKWSSNCRYNGVQR